MIYTIINVKYYDTWPVQNHIIAIMNRPYKLVLWEPTNGSARRGRKTITFVDNLREDIGLDDINEIKTMMLDRDVWRDKAKKSRARARHK